MEGMTTTTDSVRPPRFNDPDFQRIYEALERAYEKPDNKSKALMLNSISPQLTALITKLSQS
jgi:hypothetical protein